MTHKKNSLNNLQEAWHSPCTLETMVHGLLYFYILFINILLIALQFISIITIDIFLYIVKNYKLKNRLTWKCIPLCIMSLLIDNNTFVFFVIFQDWSKQVWPVSLDRNSIGLLHNIILHESTSGINILRGTVFININV